MTADSATFGEDTPRVTIGVPVYNGERYLAAALESFLSQTYPHFRIVISDNASTDGTEAISRAFAARDPRVRYERSPVNVGVGRNYQRALSFCTTPYFRWAADDDLSAPTFLERCIPVLDAHPDVVLAYPRTVLIDADGKGTEEYEDGLHLQHDRASDRFIAFMSRIRLCNVIFGLGRTEVLRRIRPLGAYVGSDIVLLAELTLHGTFWEVPEFLFSRRMHPEAASAMTPAQLQVHYRPGPGGRPPLRGWRHLWEHARSTGRAPISLGNKARVARYLLRGAIASRDILGGELLGLAGSHLDRG